jgi:regulatory associated protein of mTOR
MSPIVVAESTIFISVDGEVKLWDLRGRTDRAVTMWTLMQDIGLSAFDVHSTAEVFAG